MLRLSKLTDYAVVILAALAGEGNPVLTAASIARSSGLALPTVAKVLKKLAQAGVTTAQRGTKGGYQLARPASVITVADIVAAMDGPIALTDCVDGQSGSCGVENSCMLRGHWNQINRAIRAALESVSLADMSKPVVTAFPVTSSAAASPQQAG
jgi:FeS assembly SUF system regulator